MALHRYWRIHITASTSGSNLLLSLYDVALRATLGGLDQCRDGVASASHAEADVDKLFDDNSSSYWVNGAPAEPSWIQYDFGGGSEVDVAEVRLLPRYASQSPSTFSLLYSDDAVAWSEAASWTDVTDWVGGVEKLFSLPLPSAVLASMQQSHRFSLMLAHTSAHTYGMGAYEPCGEITQGYDLSLIGARQHPWAIRIGRGFRQPFSHGISAVHQHPFGLQLAARHRQAWKRFVSSATAHPFHAGVHRGRVVLWSLMHDVQADHRQTMVDTWTLKRACDQPSALQPRNGVRQQRCSHWNLSVPRCPLVHTVPTIGMAGLPRPILSAVLQYERGSVGWSTQLNLASETDFGRMALDAPFTLQVGEVTYRFLVDTKHLNRSSPVHTERRLEGVSPTAHHDFPRAPAITTRWSTAVWAQDVVETLLKQPVTWTLPAWKIPADRLILQGESPLSVVKRLVESVGGMVHTHPSGTITLRPLFPCSVPEWSRQEPHHRVTDEFDIVAMEERRHVQVQVDRVVVRDGPATGGKPHFDLFLDPREDHLHRGRKRMAPGATSHVVVTTDAGVALSGVTASAGTLMPARPTAWIQTEEVTFVAGNRARLTRPTTQVVSVQWLETSLGTPTLQDDGMTLLTPSSGTAVARVTYRVAATRYPFTAPASVTGPLPFPILLAATGQITNPGIREVLGQRGSAIHPLLNVTDPLLSDHRALRARAEAELDRGTPLQTLTLSIIYRPGLEPGQLIEVQDGCYGQTFRALIVGIRHALDTRQSLSHLTLLKPADAHPAPS